MRAIIMMLGFILLLVVVALFLDILIPAIETWKAALGMITSATDTLNSLY